MYAKDVLLVFTVVAVQTAFVQAGPPDWVPADLIDMVQGDKEQCMAEHGTTQAQIDQVNEGVLTNEKSISCYMYCLLDAFSLMSEDGELEAEMLLSFLPDNLQVMGNDILNKCATQDGADNCEKTFNIAKCVQQEAPQLWFMV